MNAKGIPFVAAAEAITFNGQAPDVDVMRGDRSGRNWDIVSPQEGMVVRWVSDRRGPG